MKSSILKYFFVPGALVALVALAACGGGGGSDEGGSSAGGSGAKCTILAGQGCGAGEYCNFTDLSCGETGTEGRCETVNTTIPCTGVDPVTGGALPPVCTCAGITFDEVCWATAAGQPVRVVGACQ